MDYEIEAKKFKKINLTSVLLSTLYSCIGKFWAGNYYRFSEETQRDTKVLEKKLEKKKQLNTNDIATILWILDIYGYNETLTNILANCDDDTNIETNYI